jgi:hypothetical protein
VVLVGRLFVVGKPEHRILKGEQHSRVNIESKVQVDGSAATLFGVQVDLPDLTERVRLDEVALVVHVKAVVNRVILQIGHVASNVNGCHREASLVVVELGFGRR